MLATRDANTLKLSTNILRFRSYLIHLLKLNLLGKNVLPNNEELKTVTMLEAILFDFPNTINLDEYHCLEEDFIISLNNVHTTFLARNRFVWKTAGNLQNPLMSSESFLSMYFPFL